MIKNILITTAKIGAGFVGGYLVSDFVNKNTNSKINDFMKETDLNKAREIMKEIRIDAENKVKARG